MPTRADAEALLANGRFSGAYYLAGYVIECEPKACIAKLTKPEEFPDKDLANKVYTHKLENLVHAARLDVEQLKKNDPEFETNWTLVTEWSEESRYERHSEQEAREILAAVSDPNHGVLRCINLNKV